MEAAADHRAVRTTTYWSLGDAMSVGWVLVPCHAMQRVLQAHTLHTEPAAAPQQQPVVPAQQV